MKMPGKYNAYFKCPKCSYSFAIAMPPKITTVLLIHACPNGCGAHFGYGSKYAILEIRDSEGRAL